MTNPSLAGKVFGELSEVGPSLTRRGFVSVKTVEPRESSTSLGTKTVVLWWLSSAHRLLCKNISSRPLTFVTQNQESHHCQWLWNCLLGKKGLLSCTTTRAFLHPPKQVHCEYCLLANLCLLANGQYQQIQSLSRLPCMFLVVLCLLPDFLLWSFLFPFHPFLPS